MLSSTWLVYAWKDRALGCLKIDSFQQRLLLLVLIEDYSQEKITDSHFWIF